MEMDTLLRIGNNIRNRRIELGLSQEVLASRAEVSLRTIQRIEKGESQMRITISMSISRVLNVSLDSLVK